MAVKLDRMGRQIDEIFESNYDLPARVESVLLGVKVESLKMLIALRRELRRKV